MESELLSEPSPNTRVQRTRLRSPLTRHPLGDHSSLKTCAFAGFISFGLLLQFELAHVEQLFGYVWALDTQLRTSVEAFQKDLSDPDPKLALAALRKLDKMIRIGMTEKEVRRLFPPGFLSKASSWKSKKGFTLQLNDDVSRKILRPNAWGRYGYYVIFGERARVEEHYVLLGGDI